MNEKLFRLTVRGAEGGERMDCLIVESAAENLVNGWREGNSAFLVSEYNQEGLICGTVFINLLQSSIRTMQTGYYAKPLPEESRDGLL